MLRPLLPESSAYVSEVSDLQGQSGYLRASLNFAILVTRKAVCSCALVILLAGWGACADSSNRSSGDAVSAETAAELALEEAEGGIGPVDSVELDATIDTALVAQGEAIFSMKCGACHKMTERYVGPPLGDVLERRTPEFIMNMMLNPDEMAKKHPEAKALLAEYLTQMPNQNLSQEDARAVLEFLRTSQGDADKATQ